jgi:Predicted transcription factor, homolog of eukaryotic MBF1
LGAAVKQLREEQGLFQAEVAAKTGLHASYVSDIENGKRNPTWTVLSQFAKAFNIKLSELVQRAEQQG